MKIVRTSNNTISIYPEDKRETIYLTDVLGITKEGLCAVSCELKGYGFKDIELIKENNGKILFDNR